MVNWNAGGMDAVSLGVTGAMAGSAFGPVGAAVGGGAGVIIGGLEGLFGGGDNGLSDEQKAAMEQQQKEQQTLFGEGQTQLKGLQAPSGQYGQSLDLLQSAANGGQPSQAQILMNQGLQETEGAAMGMAAANNGVSPALAMRNAMLSAGQTALRGVSQNAALRATEMATARGQYASAMMQNQQLQAQITSGQAGTAAQMAGQAGGNATQMAMPGIQTSAQTNQATFGAGINTAGSISTNNSIINGTDKNNYFGSGMSQNQFFNKYGGGDGFSIPQADNGIIGPTPTGGNIGG